MVTIYLVRHGYSVANDQKFFAGSSDVKLSAIGEQQAQLVSDYILNNLKSDKIYSSSLSRAYDTISKVGEGFNLPIKYSLIIGAIATILILLYFVKIKKSH